MSQELTLHWVGLKLDGPESFTWDRVQTAHDALREKERRDILAKARPKMRMEMLEELQQKKIAREKQGRRAIRRWIGGAVLSTMSTTTITVMALPDGSLWVKLALVAGNVIGVVATRPRSEE